MQKMMICLLALFTINAATETLFTHEPDSVTAVQGSSLLLQCLVETTAAAMLGGPSQYLVQWVKGNLALGFPPLSRDRFIQYTGPRNYSLEIENLQPEDDDDYECQITAIGLRSKVAKVVTLVPPKAVDIIPSDSHRVRSSTDIIDVVEGEMTRLRCVATDSKPQTDLEWIVTDWVGDMSIGEVLVSGSPLLTSLTELVFTPSKRDHGKRFSCLASHEAMGDVRNVTVVLNVQTLPEVTLSVLNNPVSQGETLFAECTSPSANPPVERYIWRVGDEYLEWSSSTISIPNIPHTLHNQQLSCTAINSVGNRTAAETVQIKYAPILEEIRDRIVSDLGTDISISCSFIGNPKPEVKWFRNDVLLATGSVLKLDQISQADAGAYLCLGVSEMGEELADLELIIRGPPVITSENEQSDTFVCTFHSEPAPSAIRVIDLSSSSTIYSGVESTASGIKMTLPVGHYECQVENEFGTASSLIHITYQGLSAGVKAGMVIGVLLFALTLLGVAFVKLNFLSSHHRLKISSTSEGKSGSDGSGTSRRDYHHLTQTKPLIISRPFLQQDQPVSARVTHSPLDQLLNNQDRKKGSEIKGTSHVHNPGSVSTNPSVPDDGYGTESGSHQKELASSTASNVTTSDYEVDPSSKRRIIWDDSVESDQCLPSTTTRHYIMKQRSVSQV